MTKTAANNNEPLALGDRVQLRRFPHVQGSIWSMAKGIVVQWDDAEENAYIRDRRSLQKLTDPA